MYEESTGTGRTQLLCILIVKYTELPCCIPACQAAVFLPSYGV